MARMNYYEIVTTEILREYWILEKYFKNKEIYKIINSPVFLILNGKRPVKSVLQGKLFSMYITQNNLIFFLTIRLFWDPSNNGRVSTPFPGLQFPILPPQHPFTAVVSQGPLYVH